MEKRRARLYRTGEWGGAPHYACVRCAYDTFNEAAMAAHAAGHGPDGSGEAAASPAATGGTTGSVRAADNTEEE